MAHYTERRGGTAIATVACANSEEKSQKYVAIAGGVQSRRRGDSTSATTDLAVSDSFPGRMDWTTSTPEAEPPRRLGRALDDAASRHRQVNVWAVCMKRSDNVKVQTTNY